MCGYSLPLRVQKGEKSESKSINGKWKWIKMFTFEPASLSWVIKQVVFRETLPRLHAKRNLLFEDGQKSMKNFARDKRNVFRNELAWGTAEYGDRQADTQQTVRWTYKTNKHIHCQSRITNRKWKGYNKTVFGSVCHKCSNIPPFVSKDTLPHTPFSVTWNPDFSRPLTNLHNATSRMR